MAGHKKQGIITFTVGLVVLITFVVLLNAYYLTKITTVESIRNPALEDLDIISVIDYGDDYSIICHYPLTQNEEVNRQLSDFATGKLEGFKAACAKTEAYREFFLDFSVVRHSRQIISFVFEYSQGQGETAQRDMVTFTYDLEAGSPIALGQLFSGGTDYLPLLASAAAQAANGRDDADELKVSGKLDTALAAKGKNFSRFAIAIDGLYLYYPYGALSADDKEVVRLEIPFTALGDAFLLDKGELTPLSEVKKEKPDLTVSYAELNPDAPMIALTFDDGPSSLYTPKVLALLAQYKAKATFFVLGNRAEVYGDIIADMASAGHQIGNHGYNHIGRFSQLDAASLRAQIDKNDWAVNYVADRGRGWVRPPYGDIDEESAKLIGVPIVMWNVDPYDWRSRNASKVANHVIKNADDGDIIIMHDCYDSTVEALAVILKKLSAEGYQFVTVEELLTVKGVEPTANTVYYGATKQRTPDEL